MTQEEFVAIFEDDEIDDEIDFDWTGDNAVQGLLIIGKYIKDRDLICGAEHDIIYSVTMEEVVKAGITLADATTLRKLNWMLHCHSYLACYV